MTEDKPVEGEDTEQQSAEHREAKEREQAGKEGSLRQDDPRDSVFQDKIPLNEKQQRINPDSTYPSDDSEHGDGVVTEHATYRTKEDTTWEQILRDFGLDASLPEQRAFAALNGVYNSRAEVLKGVVVQLPIQHGTDKQEGAAKGANAHKTPQKPSVGAKPALTKAEQELAVQRAAASIQPSYVEPGVDKEEAARKSKAAEVATARAASGESAEVEGEKVEAGKLAQANYVDPNKGDIVTDEDHAAADKAQDRSIAAPINAVTPTENPVTPDSTKDSKTD